ncbi:carboxypeptidase-like regulatory domain-containing protein [Archangium gephyra]|uniref:carboxypeptidase regulatory-like domain-containing protein n=1 Tax=Archangium gephyra TaxID=48 RepID=UPI0035D48642
MKRHGWKWGAVLGVLALVLWFASRGAPEAASPGGQGSSRDFHAGAGPRLQALFASAAPDGGDAALRIRGHVRGADGPVAGARVFASASVAEESLSELPCGEADTGPSALDCYGVGRLAGLVTQRSGEAPVLARATSGEDGSFSLEGLKAGHYALWVESPEGAGVRQDVAAGDEGVELLLGAGVRVSGRVLDEDKAPVAGALVTAIFKAHSRFFESVTDGTGHFRLGPLPRGEYVLLVSKEGLLPQKEEFTGYGGEVERKFYLFRPRRVSGRVVSAGAPVAGASVRTWSHEVGAELEALTDAAGRFSLEGLEPLRSYELIATQDTLWANTRVDFDTGEDPPRLLAERTDITLELEPIAEVKGVVRDAAGKPIEGVSVSLCEGEGEDAVSVSEGWTDAEGKYHLGPAAPGPLRLEFVAENYSPDSHEARFPAGTSTVDFVLQRVPDEEVVEEEPEEPSEPRPSVVGEVVDELGAPVPHAEVILWSAASSGGWQASGSTTTDARGHFALEASSNSRYRVTAEFAQDDVTHTASRVVELDKEDVRVQLRFEQGHVLSGVVVDSRGQPLEGASVALRSSARRPFFHHGRRIHAVGSSQQTGPDGRFRFQSVSGELLELYVWKLDYVLPCAQQADGRIALAVKPGERELRVVLVRMAFAQGRFARKDGTPVTSFVVNGEGEYHPDGRFSVPIQCTGPLQLELIDVSDDHGRGSLRVRHSVAVREEVDVDVGTIFLDGK